MQATKPLTPTLSPRGGEREKVLALLNKSFSREATAYQKNSFPLPIGWGEGQGEGPFRLHRYR